MKIPRKDFLQLGVYTLSVPRKPSQFRKSLGILGDNAIGLINGLSAWSCDSSLQANLTLIPYLEAYLIISAQNSRSKYRGLKSFRDRYIWNRNPPWSLSDIILSYGSLLWPPTSIINFKSSGNYSLSSNIFILKGCQFILTLHVC